MHISRSRLRVILLLMMVLGIGIVLFVKALLLSTSPQGEERINHWSELTIGAVIQLVAIVSMMFTFGLRRRK
jgi:hypothetical protein